MALDTKDLTVRIRGDTKDFENSMSGVTKSSGEAHTSFLKLSAAVAAGQAIFSLTKEAISKTTEFLQGSVKQYQEAETAQKQLEHSVIDVSHATREQLAATNDLADSLSKKGVLDDDVIRSGLAQLSTFGLTNDSVRKLGKSMADLTVNQSGVNATSEDAISAANIMAKALNGNYGALEKMGIHLTDTQRKLIKFGNETQKVDTINQVMAANLRTNQATALETSAGKLAHLNVMYGNIRETIGKVIIDALTPLLTKLTDFASKINWDDLIKRSVSSLKVLWSHLKSIAEQVFDAAKKIEIYLQPKVVALWHTIEQSAPTFQKLWKEVLAPLAKILGEVLVFAIGLVIDAINALMKVLTPLINFMLEHKTTVMALATVFGILAVAMNFNSIVGGFMSAMDLVIGKLVATQASASQLATFLTGTGAAAFGVIAGAALIAAALIIDAGNKTKAAWDATARSIQSADKSNDEVIRKLRDLKANGTPEQRARATSTLAKLAEGGSFASGGFTGRGMPNDVAGIVHKGEFVIPQEGVDQSTGLPKVGGGDMHVHLHVGMYAGMPVEKRQIALELYKELTRAARAHGVQLQPIGAVGVQ